MTRDPTGVTVDVVRAESSRFRHPLLMLHGLWTGAWIWRDFAAYLAHRGWDAFAPSFLTDVVARDASERLRMLEEIARTLPAPPIVVDARRRRGDGCSIRCRGRCSRARGDRTAPDPDRRQPHRDVRAPTSFSGRGPSGLVPNPRAAERHMCFCGASGRSSIASYRTRDPSCAPFSRDGCVCPISRCDPDSWCAHARTRSCRRRAPSERPNAWAGRSMFTNRLDISRCSPPAVSGSPTVCIVGS